MNSLRTNPEKSACPDRDQLQAFGAGRLDEAELESIAEHLGDCHPCEAALETNPDFGDTLVARLRLPPPTDPILQEPQLDRLLARACAIPLGSSVATPVVEDDGESLPIEVPVEQLPERIGQYELQGRIGRGGMGVVYKARHASLKRTVALKLLPADRVGDPRMRQRFYREMEAIGQLRHDNIVHAYDAGEAAGIHYLAMEFVDGCDVETLARLTGRMAVADACEIGRQAAIGLHHAHDHSLIHRDVKPSNLLLDTQGCVKVSDLGLASMPDAADRSDATSSGHILGTLDYLPPEQGLSGSPLNQRADLYSLGCVLYRLLAGQVPFYGDRYNTALEKLRGHATDEASPLSVFRDDVPEELWQLIQQLLSKSPADRYENALDVAARLEPHTTGHALPALLQAGRRKLKLSTEDRDHDAVWSGVPASGSTAPFSRQAALTSTVGRVRGRSGDGARRKALPLGLFLLVTLSPVAWYVSSRWIMPERIPGPPITRSRALFTMVPKKSELPPTTSIESTPYSLTPPGELDKLVWHTLLNAEPQVLRWPNGPLSSKFLDKQKQQLSVSCRTSGLLRMGTIPEGNGFQLQMDIYQNNWAGGCGCFVGFQERDLPRGRGVCFLQFDIRRRFGQDDDEFPLALWWSEVSIVDNPGGVDFIGNRAISSQKIPRPPALEEQMLEITVRSGQLTRLRWGGTELEMIPKPLAEAQQLGLGADDFVGDFGTYNFISEATFRNARIMLF